jgi:tRNA threonylcarbamoyl adenosine modification protein (Sua5/YciO/YrdC/YwlC family)
MENKEKKINLINSNNNKENKENTFKSYDNYNKNIITPSAKILQPTEENFKLCGEYLNNGGIVGMPTETVYGLAANAFDISAVKKIFKYKGRPLSDPLIVHITNLQMAKDLINLDEISLQIFEKLAEKFWPGPLTIVSKANFNKISPILTANTEFIGLRFPNNKVAEKLINISGVPLAAPSANKFCHVSPVNPKHVYDDFIEFPVYILDDGVCNFSMESTVIKLNINNSNNKDKDNTLINTNINTNINKIEILRKGAISKNQLENFFNDLYEKEKDNINFLNKNKFEIVFMNKDVKVPLIDDVNKEIEELSININKNLSENSNSNSKENLNNFNREAPGQFIKHYSPNIETYLFDFFSENENEKTENDLILNIKDLSECVLLDFKETIKSKFPEKTFLRIFDFSIKGCENEVMQNIYSFLREAENEKNAKFILICDLNKYLSDENNQNKPTLVDRINKASSSRRILFK